MSRIEPVEWRVEGFRRLGFDATQAIALAYSKDATGVWLYHADVAKLVKSIQIKHGINEEEARQVAFSLRAEIGDDGES